MLPAPPPPVGAALAAAAAIVSIASSIKGVFDAAEQQRTQREIINKLNEIQAKLDDIDNKLNTIIGRFAELEFHIDQDFERNRAVDVITAISRIDQYYPTWTKKGWNPRRDPTVPAPKDLLEELRRTTTALQETPSYANFSTVALAMAYERLLLVQVFHVKLDKPDARSGFTQYANYFQKAASSNSGVKPMTVGFRWGRAYSEWTVFQQNFAKRPTPLYCDSGRLICCEQPTNWWYVGKVLYRYNGDLLTGFSSVAEESNLVAGPGGTAGWLCYNSERPVYPRRSGCPKNVGNVPAGSCDLDQQHATAVALKETYDDLNAALDSLRDFTLKAQEWAGVPSGERKFIDPRGDMKLDLHQQELLEQNPSLKAPEYQ